MVEGKKDIKRKKRSWIKWLAGGILFLLVLLTIFLPPVYTRVFIRPAIEEGFQQAMSNKYAIEFEEIDWNLLGRKLSMDKVRIVPLFQSDSSDRIDLKLDKLSVEKIRYGKLLKGDIKLGKINLDGLVIYRKQGFKPDKQKKDEPQLDILQSLDIQEIELDIDTVVIIEDMDSILNVFNGKVNIESFSWDAISKGKQQVLPRVGKMSSSFESLLINNEKSRIELKNFKISENELSRFHVLFENIDFKNHLNGNSVFLKWTSLEIDSAQRLHRDSTLILSAKELAIETDSLYFEQKTKGKFKPEQFIGSIKDLAGEIGINVQIDRWMVRSKTACLDQINWTARLKEYKLDIEKIRLSEKEATIGQYVMSMENSLVSLVKSSDSISFATLELMNDRLKIRDLNVKPENEQFEFNSEQLIFSELSFDNLIFNRELLLNKLLISKPVVKIKKGERNNKTKSTFPFDFKIHKLLVEDGNLDHYPVKLFVSSFNLNVDTLSGKAGDIIKVDSVFNRLRFDCGNIILGTKEDKVLSEAKNILIDSREGLLSLSDFSVQQNSQNNLFDFESNDLRFKGVDWRSFINNPTFLNIESIKCMNIVIDGDNNSIFSNNAEPAIKFDFMIRNLELPNVEVQYKLGDNKSLYFEKLSVSADSLTLFPNEKRPLIFSDLELLSGYSSYTQDFDSLLITSQGWGFSSEQSNWYSKGVFIKHLFSNDSISASSDLKLNIPLVTITGLDPYDYLVDRKIGLDSINIVQPEISFVGERNKRSGNRNTLNWQQELRKIVEKFVHIDLDYINVVEAEFDIKNKYLNRQDEINLNHANLEIQSFYLDYQTFKEWNRFFFSDNFDLSFNDYFHSVNNGEYLLGVEQARLNSVGRSLKLNGISMLSLSGRSELPLNFNIGEFGINNFYLNATSYLPELEIESVIIKDPDIQLKVPKNQAKRDRINLDSIHLYEYFKNYLNAIELDSLELENCNIDIGTSERKIIINGIGADIERVRIDSLNEIFTRDKFFYSGKLNLVIPDYSWISKDRLYRYQFESIEFNSSERSLEVDSMQIVSRYDRKTFSANLSSQKDQTDALFPLIRVSDIDLRDLVLRERFTAGRFELFQPEIRIFKDKTIKVDTSDYKYMPADQLNRLGIYLNIDTALVHEGFVQYEEYSGLMNTPGKIFFNDMNIRFTGISNDKDFMMFGGALRILATGKMMGKSDVSVTAVFPLKSKEQEFMALASMRQLDAIELNPLIQPLTLLSAKDGNLMQMQMNIKGNNKYAYGEMLLKYENLKVEVLNKRRHRESGLATFLANSFMIRKNNKNFLFPRKGPIYYDRITYRSFIHYLSHFAIVGAKTSIGVDKRKVQKKVNEAATLEIE